MMLGGPQLAAGPAAGGGDRSRLLALYVQDYLECVESLPLDIQRNVSLLREMDTQCRGEPGAARPAGHPSPTRDPRKGGWKRSRRACAHGRGRGGPHATRTLGAARGGAVPDPPPPPCQCPPPFAGPPSPPLLPQSRGACLKPVAEVLP